MERIANNILNCPNCGAPINGANCEYCGVIFYDFANLDADGPSYIRLRFAGRLLIFKALTTSVCVENRGCGTTLYADNVPYYTVGSSPDYHITLEMDVVPDDRGVMFEKRMRQ